MSKETETTQYERRRFSLTTEISKLAEEIAEEDYGGNTSALIRDAIREKANRPDEKEIRAELRRIRMLIEKKLQGQNQKTGFSYGQMTDQSSHNRLKPFEFSDSDRSLDNSSGEEKTARIARKLNATISNTDKEPVNFVELVNGMDASVESVATGVMELSKRDAINYEITDSEIQIQSASYDE